MKTTLRHACITFALVLSTGCGSNSISPTSPGITTTAQTVRAAAQAGTHVLFHEYAENCNAAFIDAAQDPIVHPGEIAPAAQHVHTFFGNLSIKPNSTAATLMAAPSTCNATGGHQAWWIPQASLDGVPVHPKAIVAYYKMGPDGFSANVVPLPQGIRILLGNSKQTADQFRAVGSWTCGNQSRTADVPNTCPSGSDLVVRLAGPNCVVNLTNTDSPTHRAHIVYPVKGRSGFVCPADHPIAVAMPELKISYAVNGTNLQQRFKLSEALPNGTVGPYGPAWSFHADEIFAFDPATFAHLVDYCINGGRKCDHTGNGPHLTN